MPNGSTIVFKAGGTYRVSQGLRLANRHDLVFEGNGATIRTTGAGDSLRASPFLIDGGSSRITMRDLTLVGNNPDAGTANAYHPSAENQMGIAIYGAQDIDIHDVTIRGFYSDCVYIGSTGNSTWADTVHFHDSTCRLSGRNGVTLIAGRDITIERVSFDQIGASILDIEPDSSTEGAADVMVRDNTIGAYGLNDLYTSWLLAAEGATGSDIRRVSIIGNTISGTARSGYEGKALGLHVSVRNRGPRVDFVVRDNTSTRTVAGPSMQFIGVDGVTVTGNTQPLSSGSLATYPSSTNVTHANNQ